MSEESVVTIGQVARMLNTDPYRIRYLLVRGRCQDVPQLANRRIFGPSDILRIKHVLEADKDGQE